MGNNVRFKEFAVECCNYNLGKGDSVPMHCREVFNEDTGETIAIDYSGHSLFRAFETEGRGYSFDYVCNIIRLAFDDILDMKCGEKFAIVNKSRLVTVIGFLYISDREDTYVLSIRTVVYDKNRATRNINKRDETLSSMKVIELEIDELGAEETIYTTYETEEEN